LRPITLLEPFRALFYAPFYVAEARGTFARQGLDLRLVTAGTPTAAAEKLLAGEADLAWSGPMRPMLMRSQDPACTLKSFCAVVMRDPFLLVGRGEQPDFQLPDLATLRLGLVSEVPTPVWCLMDDLLRLGINPARLATVTDRGMAENAAAMVAGGLDVAQLFEPFACQAEDAGGAVWHAQASRGLTAYTAFYATEAGLAARRTELQGMVRAMAEALAFMRGAAPSEIAEAIAPRFPDVPEAHRIRAIARYQALDLWSPDPRFPRAAFDRLGAAMLACGAISHVPPFEDCVEEALVEEALAP
jgi:NitT/TauT family transport system substrate-binding protein